MSSSGTTVVGLIVSILIVGAVASLGYFQFVVAPALNNTTSSSTPIGVNCATSHSCVNVTIISGAGTPYSGYTPGSTTLFGYQPPTLTVVIGVNNTVVWTNTDTAFAFHTATSSSGPASFNSRCIDGVGAPCAAGTGPSSNSFQFTFTVAGTYHYSCNYHVWMQGTIIVKSA